jgi:putative copper export protein
MLGGATVTVVAGLFSIVVAIVDPNLINSGKKPTSSQLTGDIVQVLVLTIVYCALWLVMARKNRSGRPWARIVASVLFALSTISLYSSVNSLHAGQTVRVVNIVSFVLVIAEWLCGLGAVALLWRAESGVYFKSSSALR